jgi:ribulose-phosphate 3-epimerase
MILAPSILSSDYAHLGDEVAAAARGGATLVHVDVMDGHFVPNITLGPPIVASLHKATPLPLDVHLMIENADRYLQAFVDAGAAWVSLHQEAVPHLQGQVAFLRERGVRAGVALNPATPLSTLDEILPELDYVLVMSVNPGFGGQKFIKTVLSKIRRVKEMIRTLNPACELEVDGGIAADTIETAAEAGASAAGREVRDQ